MCTIVILRRPDHQWPLLVASNRDEKTNRPWRSPGRHWQDRPEVVAGIDELGNGTWLGVNDYGVMAAVTNRKNTLGNDPRLRSRGELVLEALDHPDALDAIDAILDVEPAAYRGFNFLVADNRDAWWVRSTGPDAAKVEAFEIPEGISIITSGGANELNSARTRFYLPKFERATIPNPEKGDWSSWEELLQSTDIEAGAGSEEAMLISPRDGYGTVSSSLIALGTPFTGTPKVIWRFSGEPGRPGSFQDIDLGARI